MENITIPPPNEIIWLTILPNEIIWLIIYHIKNPNDIISLLKTSKILYQHNDTKLWSYLISSYNLKVISLLNNKNTHTFDTYKSTLSISKAIYYAKYSHRIDYIYFYNGHPLNDDLVLLPGYFGIENDVKPPLNTNLKLSKVLPMILKMCDIGIYAMYIKFSNLKPKRPYRERKTIIQYILLYKIQEGIDKVVLVPTSIEHQWEIKKSNILIPNSTTITFILNKMKEIKLITSPLSI